ncbi:MAG: hypothetical protein EHM48_00105 [Planctomycetaceae bacterium]|nr:MAG: hypothetical protein EHM48_00105 [Planctomycetaceae bacterium]
MGASNGVPGAGKMEGLLWGTVGMLDPVLVKSGRDAGFSLSSISESNPYHRFYQVFQSEGDNPTACKLGSIEIQQLPSERVLITFDPKRPMSNRIEMTDHESESYWRLIHLLIERLNELGFVPLPEPEPRKIGFASPLSL